MDSSSIAKVFPVGVAVGIGLVTPIIPALRELQRDVADLREHMPRLEGLFEGFTRRVGPGSSTGAPA